jgi:putative SOS response-associated peptidase YedK
MCGRYASARKRHELLEEFQVQADHVTEPLEADYNVAPTKQVYGVLMRRERAADGDAPGEAATVSAAEPPGPAPTAAGSQGDRGAGERGRSDDSAGRSDLPVTRQLRVLRWGLVPSWAKDPSIGSKLINARAETLAVKASFRRAFARRRCLLPADGYYEWQTVPVSGGRARKQPFFMCPRDGGMLAMAGLYELWRALAAPADQPGPWLWTVTIITTQATDEFGHLHDRMPMIVERGSWAHWLDPARTSPGALDGLMVPAASAGLDMRPVSPAVNNVRNNGPGLIEPAPPSDDPAEVPASLF